MIVATNYNADCSWILDYTDDYLIYDRSETDEFIKPFDPGKVRKVPNVGNADYDKMCHIVEFYDDLPEVFLLTKGNLFKYIPREEFEKVKDNRDFTPLLSQNHAVGLPMCFYSKDGMYNEINEDAYIHISRLETRVKNYAEWAHILGLPNPPYLRFAPGGNYIVTRERIRRYPKEFYAKIRDMLGYTRLPAEAQMLERTYYTLWS